MTANPSVAQLKDDPAGDRAGDSSVLVRQRSRLSLEAAPEAIRQHALYRSDEQSTGVAAGG